MVAAQRSIVAVLAMDVLSVFCYVFVHKFLFNPHFDLEPDYIIRIERYSVRTAEILPIFHT